MCVQRRETTSVQLIFVKLGEVFAQQWELNDWRRGAINVSEGPERG